MKRSSEVPATLIATLAAGMVGAGCGCGSSGYSGYSECRDSLGRRLPDSYCAPGSTWSGARWVHVQSGGYGGTGTIFSGSGTGGSFGG